MLHARQVLTLLLDNSSRNGGLTPYRLDRRSCAFQRERLEPFWDRCNVVRLFCRPHLTEHEPSLAHPRTDSMNNMGRSGVRPTTRLAVDRHAKVFQFGLALS